MKRQKGNILLLLACIFSYLMVAISVAGFVFLVFNIAGVKDIYADILINYAGGKVNADEQITMMCVEFALVALIDLYYANFYLKGYRHYAGSRGFGRALVNKGIFQILLASFVPGLFAIIAGVRMGKNHNAPEINVSEKTEFMNNYKFEAMSEAVSRLKELRDKGAISEEEYYATLNKILES